MAEVTTDKVIEAIKRRPLPDVVAETIAKGGKTMFTAQVEMLEKQLAEADHLPRGTKAQLQTALNAMKEADEKAKSDIYEIIAKAILDTIRGQQIPLQMRQAGDAAALKGGAGTTPEQDRQALINYLKSSRDKKLTAAQLKKATGVQRQISQLLDRADGVKSEGQGRARHYSLA